MAKLHDQWIILSHGPLREIDEGLLTVVGQIPMPFGNFPRRMTVVRLSGGRTAIFSAIPLEEAEMKRLEALGEPAFLIVPSGIHRLDIRPYRARYPKARVVAPAGAREQVSEAVAVDLVTDRLDDPDAHFLTVGGTGDADAAMLVRRPGGASLIVNDIIGHVTRASGFGPWLISLLTGFGTKRPVVPRPVKAKLVGDPAPLATQFEEWAAIPGLIRIIPSHGEIIDDQPAAELRRLAQSVRS